MRIGEGSVGLTESGLVMDWDPIGTGLETDWHRIGNSMTFDWLAIGLRLAMDCRRHQIANLIDIRLPMDRH